MEQSRDLGGAPQGRLGAEDVGKEPVARVVAPQVSIQAVDQLPVTGAELHLAEGPELCKQDAKCRMRKGRYALPALTPRPASIRTRR